MSYTMWWEIDKHVLYVRFTGDTTVDEFLEMMQAMRDEILLNGGPFVNIISDVRNLERPLSLTDLMAGVRRFEKLDQMGWSIMVGDSNPIIRFMSNVAGQFLGQRMRSFDTPEEAMDFLREFDTSIEWDTGDDA